MSEPAPETAAAAPPTPAPPLHRDYGIPDEVVATLGPVPAVGDAEAKRFFQLLRAFAEESPPLSFADWCDLWDQASARYALPIIRRAKRVLIPLYRDRAIKEITRPNGLRFVPHNSYKFAKPDHTLPIAEVERTERPVDPVEAKQILKDLNLPEGAVDDLAFILSQELAAPLEALEATKLAAARAAARELERRQDRRAQRGAPGADLPVQDAEFSEPQGAAAPVVQLDEMEAD
jgi:hypothetical protein